MKIDCVSLELYYLCSRKIEYHLVKLYIKQI